MLRRVLRHVVGRPGERELSPAAAYDLWSETYDRETDNVLTILEGRVFAGLLRTVEIRERDLVDVGCGTGRHWNALLDREPSSLVGYDVSLGMLDALRCKFSRAITYLSGADSLSHTPDRGCDVVISTLALCHVSWLEGAIAEWGRVLRPGGEVVVTDYHPAASAAGNCTFRHEGRLIAVKIHVHSIDSLESAAARNGLQVVAFDVATADDSIKPAYASSGMLPVFERIRGQPLIYGARMCKTSRP